MAKAVIRYWDYTTTMVDGLGVETMHILVSYSVGDINGHIGAQTTFDVSPLDTEVTAKAACVSAVVADAAVNGYTIVASDIRFPDLSRGV